MEWTLGQDLPPSIRLQGDPDLVEPETLDALRGLVRGSRISDRRAAEAITDLANLRLMRYPHAPLRVWGLRGNLTGHGATYLALAEALDEPLLMTADAALAEVARTSLGADRVSEIDER